MMKQHLLMLLIACIALGCSKQPDQAKAPTYDVVITGNPDGRFIIAIKGIREVTGLGLADAKALFDNMPSVVKSCLTKDEAEIIAERLRSSSLSVEVKQR